MNKSVYTMYWRVTMFIGVFQNQT